jgi:hypothetical protein
VAMWQACSEVLGCNGNGNKLVRRRVQSEVDSRLGRICRAQGHFGANIRLLVRLRNHWSTGQWMSE